MGSGHEQGLRGLPCRLGLPSALLSFPEPGHSISQRGQLRQEREQLLGLTWLGDPRGHQQPAGDAQPPAVDGRGGS